MSSIDIRARDNHKISLMKAARKRGGSMKGTILCFRSDRAVIVEPEDASLAASAMLVGRRAVWVHPKTGEKYVGKVCRLHGRRGKVLVKFRRGLPGQAVGTEVMLA